jgi:hypothetical protein
MEEKELAMDERELAKQFVNYTDAVTAFAFVQGAAFGLLVGQNSSLATNVAGRYIIASISIVCMTLLYLYALQVCHREEDRLVGKPSERGPKLKTTLNFFPQLRRQRRLRPSARSARDSS